MTASSVGMGMYVDDRDADGSEDDNYREDEESTAQLRARGRSRRAVFLASRLDDKEVGLAR